MMMMIINIIIMLSIIGLTCSKYFNSNVLRGPFYNCIELHIFMLLRRPIEPFKQKPQFRKQEMLDVLKDLY